MFIWTQEIETTDWNLVTFKDGTTRNVTDKEMTYLVTETETDDSTLAEMYEFKMIEQIFDVFKTCDILKSFDKDEKTRDQNNVDIVASVIMRMTEYNFRISKLQYIFSYLKGFIWQIESLTNNNIKAIEEDILVKALGIETQWSNNAERLYNVTFPTYAKFLNK